ncbi:MAG: hypothetical protein ED556_10520 [Winogradskyella sp.]|uniref:hypothetical protein n=1 Tax=Winogradskyella sp. TaxID=1883156 RepID=UPI000F3F994B|nr:hypothetical protein [Winogradskyella sp.]RNC85158.1 MAG: hypothetical protein ED556_10520 [Winogradskyella sp.]
MIISKRLKILIGIATLILLIPLIAMQFTQEVNWNFTDFIVAGILLYSAAISINFVIGKKGKSKVILIITILIILLLLWTEMAVGIFGSPIAGS